MQYMVGLVFLVCYTISPDWSNISTIWANINNLIIQQFAGAQ